MARRSTKSRNAQRRVGGTHEQAYPSCPSRPPKINVWIKFGEDLGQLQIHSLVARWAAIKFIQTVLNGRELNDEPDDQDWYLTTDDALGIKINGDVAGLLDELDTEVEWEIPQPDLNTLRRAAGLMAVRAAHELDEPEKPNRVRKVRSPTAAPVSRDGLVSLAEICADLKIEPRDARKTLRNKVEKPDAGWAWPADEAKKIKAMLK